MSACSSFAASLGQRRRAAYDLPRLLRLIRSESRLDSTARARYQEPTRMIATVLFDLDGVLVDSRSSIATCMRHALDGAGLAAPDDHVLHAHIGPPIHDSFEALVTRLGGDAGLVPALV